MGVQTRPRATSPTTDSPRLRALRLLGRRDYTELELRARLEDHYPRQAIDETIAALKADGAIDDLRAANAHVRTAARVKGRGRHRIRRELEARGVAADSIARALEQVSDEDQDGEIARIIARKRPVNPGDPKARQRLFQQLLRRGFDAGAIGRALRK